jgi:peroxisomal trans-2-enoyl-CoA reductase
MLKTVSIFRSNLLHGKTAIVSGGSTGIGYNIAKELMDLGCHVIIASRSEERLKNATEELRRNRNGNGSGSGSDGVPNGAVDYYRTDIREPNDVKALMSYAVDTFGGSVDYLVNNGGGQFPSAAEELSENGWNAVINTNLNGTFRMCREAVLTGKMQENGGSIVNIICTHFQGFPGMAHTGAARAGVDNLTKTLASEWASFGIRVNSVAPGVIYSQSAEGNYSNKQKHPNNQFERYLSSQAPRIPFRRLGTTQEVSNVVTFLLSPGGSYTSGSTYVMDGAFTCSGGVGSDTFLRRTKKPPREAFPFDGYLPDFCIAEDDRVAVMASAETDIQEEIHALELKLAALRLKK